MGALFSLEILQDGAVKRLKTDRIKARRTKVDLSIEVRSDGNLKKLVQFLFGLYSTFVWKICVSL